MCGILGLITQEPVAPTRFGRALRLMTHRGPDDEGVETFSQPDGSQVWLGHRRLSILDLSPRGHQPMSDPSRRYWIVFNGEIYNFREMRAALEAKGFAFQTGTDTEVILAAYAAWGEDCLARLNGMFAFAIWDQQDRTLFAARDRLGVKPFYHAALPGGGIAFGSEVKSLLQLPGVPRELDRAALPKYLTFLSVPDPDTLFRGVKKLPPGHSLRWRDGKMEIKTWWDAPLQGEQTCSFDKCVADVQRGFAESVKARLISDVPLGVFLSGGVDSSAVLAVMRGETRDPIITFTVGFRKQDLSLDVIPDDVRYSHLMAARMQPLDFNLIELTPAGFNAWPKLVWHLDEPLPDPGALPTYLICREARRKATVMLTGVGGEELFGGYPRHRAAQLAGNYRRLPGALRALVRGGAHALPVSGSDRMYTGIRNLKKFLRSAELPFDDAYLGFISFFNPDELTRLLGRAVSDADVYDRHRAHLQRAAAMEPLNRIFYLDLKTFLPCVNLAYGDKCSMAASIEAREPIIDYRLVETVMRMPAEHKLRGREQKRVFKRAVAGWVPDEILRRKKAGFSSPVRAWIKKDYRNEVADLLFGKRFRDRGLLDPAIVKQVYDDNLSGREDYALRLWSFVTLELWCQTFLDRAGEEPLS